MLFQSQMMSKIINLSTKHCVINYFVAHYFFLIVDIWNKICGFLHVKASIASYSA